MTTTTVTSQPEAVLRKTTDYYASDDRWYDDADNGDRWRAYGACVGTPNPDLFFPVEGDGEDGVGDEPAYPPPDVKEICDHCPVRAICLTRNLEEPFGIFGSTTGYQRGLLTRKIKRKTCPGCGSDDVVTKFPHHEICLACAVSWEVL